MANPYWPPPADWARIDTIFTQALDLDPERWPAFLEEACGEDVEVRTRVTDLLRRSQTVDDFLEESCLEVQPELAGELAHRLESRDTPFPTEARIGAYRIIDTLGRGGAGTVYLAERAEGQERPPVALKVLRRGVDTDDLLERFTVERQILATLDHPDVARLLDAGATEDGRPYLVMEHVDGEPITEHCGARSLSVEERLGLFVRVARAVHHAHGSLIVHRDLKPTNVLVAEDGAPKLLDFGIAKLLDPDALAGKGPQTRTGTRLLTPGYASPEQRRGEPVTPASDIYQLGLLLYELLTGVAAYEAAGKERGEKEEGNEGGEEKRRAYRDQWGDGDRHLPRIPVPSKVARRTGETSPGKGTGGETDPATEAPPDTGSTTQRRRRRDLDRIVMTALEEDPGDRYPTAAALAADVERVLKGQRPHGVAHLPMGILARKLARRLGTRRRKVAAAALAIGAVGGILAVANVMLRGPGDGEPPAADPGDAMLHLVPPPWVVVADFDAPADEPELGWAVRELVMEGLDMTGGVAPVPNRELGATLRMAGLPDTARVDRARARELALRAGLPAALTGSVFRLGNGYAIRANAQNPEDGHVLVSVLERSADQDGLMGAAERLANRLASELAESVGTQQQVRPATLLTTSSFDAYEQYLRWLRANRERMDPAEQRGILRQALDIDPQFAMAWRALALHHRYYNPRNQPDSARAALDRAMALRNQVTDLERLHIEAVEAYIIQGWEGDDALIDIYGRILSINPRDESALNNRALALRRQGRRAEAVEHDRALLALFPETEAVRNIGARFSSLMFVGQLEEAKNLLPRLPEESSRLEGETRIALASHEWAVAERLALSWRHHRTMWASDDWWLTLAAVRAARGSVRAADSLLKVLPPRHVNNRLVLALATGCDLALGRPLPAPEDCSDDGSNWQQRGVETEHRWNAVIPTVMGHQDLVADLQSAVTAALSNFPPHVGAFHNRLLSALEHAGSGNWRAVTETVQSLDNPQEVGLSGTTALRWLAGDAYERLGQLDSAAVYFHRVADSANFLQGEYDLRGFTYPFAQRRLAFIYAGMGDRSRAEHHWDVFRNTFTDPDPELRWLLEESPLRRRLLPGRARERAIAGGGLFSDSHRACASIEAGRIASFERALVATAEWFEGYLAEHGRYPTSGFPGLPEEIGRLGNLLIMTEGDEAGWIATAVDFRDTRICRLGGGEGPGAAEGDRSGEMTCFQHTHDEAHPQIGPLLAMGETFNRLLEDVRWWLVWSSTRPGFDAFPPQLTARGAPGQDGLPKPGDLYANWAYPEVRIEILQWDAGELRALATHPNSPVRCTLRVTDDLHVFLSCSTPGSVPPGGG